MRRLWKKRKIITKPKNDKRVESKMNGVVLLVGAALAAVLIVLLVTKQWFGLALFLLALYLIFR